MLGYEVLGIERRRRWSATEKHRIIAEAFSAAEGVSSVARRHGLYPQQIYRWRRDLVAGDVAEASEVRFLPVSVTSTAAAEVAPVSAEVTLIEIGCLGGRSLRIDRTLSDARLQHLIRLVETA